MKIDLKEYEYLEDRSFYNNNYYKDKLTGDVILIKCNEFFNELIVYRVVDSNLSRIGTHYGEDNGVYEYD